MSGMEVWNGYNGIQITAPDGTFEAIFNDTEDDEEDAKGGD